MRRYETYISTWDIFSEKFFDLGKSILTFSCPFELLIFSQGDEEKKSCVAYAGEEARKGSKVSIKLFNFLHIGGIPHINDRL